MKTPTPTPTPTSLPLPDYFYTAPWYLRGGLPAVAPPPNTLPNYIDPPTLTRYGIATATVCLLLATVLVSIRLFTKLHLLRKAGWEDYTSVLALFGLIAFTGLSLKADEAGYGHHLWDITGNQYIAVTKMFYVMSVVFAPVIFLVKLSIILQYMRMFRPVKWAYITFHIVLWLNFAYYFASIFAQAFQCKPIEKAWYTLAPGTCENQRAGQIASAGLNLGSDLLLLILPIICVWNLKTKTSAKLGIMVIFGMGFLACIASGARLIVTAKGSFTGDGFWELYSIPLLSIAELTCGVIVGCLPALPAFFRWATGRDPNSSRGRSKPQPYTYDPSDRGSGRSHGRGPRFGLPSSASTKLSTLVSPHSPASPRSYRQEKWHDVDSSYLSLNSLDSPRPQNHTRTAESNVQIPRHAYQAPANMPANRAMASYDPEKLGPAYR